jgi:molybdate-binding protein
MDPTERALKQVTTTQIEEAVSKTLSELVGKEYTAEVLNIDFNPIQNSSVTDTVEIKLRISREWVESAIKKLEQEEVSDLELQREQGETRLSNASPIYPRPNPG